MRALLVLLMAGLIGGPAFIERRQAREMEAMAKVDKVDMGVRLVVVKKDPIAGEELIPGLPRMTQVRAPINLGGLVQVDRDGARIVGPSKAPVVWHVSELQARLILHADSEPLWSLIEGSEGSNKTATLARWVAVRVLEHIGQNVEGGITAPTTARLGHVKEEIAKWWPARWYRFNKNDSCYRFHCGPRVQLVSAVQRSEEAGSPIQGANWVFHAGDEFQDHFSREADIEARGRTARDGRYKRINTSTPKDSSEWRTFRDKCATSTMWGACRMLGMDSPFVSDKHWQNLRAAGTMTEREWKRRVLAMDVGAERAVYFNWRRNFDNGKPANLGAIPDGARDITADVLAAYGRNVAMLIGHDPGTRQHVSMFLKAYRLPSQRKGDDRPRWFVVDEVTTPESTVHAHASVVLKRLRDRWHCHGFDHMGRPDPNAPIALVRIDPHTRGGEDHPGADVASIWRGLGMNARAAAYKANSVEPATIKRRTRIDLVNTLLSATAEVGEVRRLFVALNDDGTIAAPHLVKAFETMEFDAAGKAETEKKDADDLSHWPAALGYALLAPERQLLGLSAEVAA